MDMRTIYRKAMWLGALAGLLALGGCGGMRLSSVDTLLKRDPPASCVGEGKLYRAGGDGHELDIEGFLKQAKMDKKSTGEALDGFLDCTVADIGPDASANLKAYRGYVTLAVLSRYAAFNYTGMIGGYADLNFQSYDGLQDDAMSTLARIDFADRMMRLGSGVEAVAATVSPADMTANPTLAYIKQIGTPDKLPDVETLHRALSVLVVAGSAEKPTVKRARNWFSNLLAAIGGTLTHPGSLIDDGLNVIGKSLTLRSFGNAYLNDARRDVEAMKNAGPARPSQEDWNYWANVIQDACTRIATSTGATSHCEGGGMAAQAAAGAPAKDSLASTISRQRENAQSPQLDKVPPPAR